MDEEAGVEEGRARGSRTHDWTETWTLPPRDALSREAWQVDTVDVPRTGSGGAGHAGSSSQDAEPVHQGEAVGSPGHWPRFPASPERWGGGTGPGIQRRLRSCGTLAVFSGFFLTLSGPWFLHLQDRK